MKFSVLMAVYAGDNPTHFDEALNHICAQTLAPDQVVLVQDGPVSPAISATMRKYRSRLPITEVTLETNSGLAAALNAGLDACDHDIVVRSDADDINLPNRFQIQVMRLVGDPSISVLGSWAREFDDAGHWSFLKKMPTGDAAVRKFAKRRNPLCHPAVAMRKSHVLSVGGYPQIYPEDYLLWARILKSGRCIDNIQQELVKIRMGPEFFTRRGGKFLRGELRSQWILYREGFLNLADLVQNVVIRTVVRLGPVGLRRKFYMRAR